MSITCENAKLMISIQAEGDLSASDAAILNTHLKTCRHCAAYQRDIRQIQTKLTNSLPDNTDCADIADLVMAQLPAETRRPTFRPIWLLAPGLCALVVAVIFASSVLHKPQTHQTARTIATPVVPTKKLPEPDKIAVNPPTSAPVLVKTPAHAKPKQQKPAQKPKDNPKQPATERPAEKPITTPAEPPVIASAPVDQETPTPGRIHLDTPDSGVVIARDDFDYDPNTTSAYVCVDVASPDGVKSVPLYRMPAMAPRRSVSIALSPQQKEIF